MSEIGKERGKALAEQALDVVENELGVLFSADAYAFLRSHLTGNFKRFYIRGNFIYSGAHDDIVRNQKKQRSA